MALITCPECGKQISNLAPACIHCGFPLSLLDKSYEQNQEITPHQETIVNPIEPNGSAGNDKKSVVNNSISTVAEEESKKDNLFDMVFIKLEHNSSKYPIKTMLETSYGYPKGLSYAHLEKPGSILIRGIKPENINYIKSKFSTVGCVVDFVPSKEKNANPLNSVWDGGKTLEDVLEKQAYLKTPEAIQKQKNGNLYYCIKVIKDQSLGDRFTKFCQLLTVFPGAYENYSFKKIPYLIGTGLTKDNAEWYKEEFSRFRVSIDVEIDESCLDANTPANKFAEEERNGVIHCPRCHATAVTTGQRGFSIITGPIGSSKTTNRCAKCGYKWYPK